jgi:hypothetical protein
MKVLFAILIVLGLAVFSQMVIHPPNIAPTKAYDLEHGDPAPPGYHPMTDASLIEPPGVKLSKLVNNYGLSKGTLVLTNHNTYPIADAVITCDATAPSGTVVKNYTFTIYEVLQPSKQKSVSYDFGFWPQQGTAMGCHSIGATRR